MYLVQATIGVILFSYTGTRFIIWLTRYVVKDA